MRCSPALPGGAGWRWRCRCCWLAYLVYVFFAFDVAGVAGRARMDNARTLLADFWSYKTHVTRDNRSGEVTVAIEGESKGTYPPDRLPDWVTTDGAQTRIDLGGGHLVTYDADAVRYLVPGYGTIDAAAEGRPCRPDRARARCPTGSAPRPPAWRSPPATGG